MPSKKAPTAPSDHTFKYPNGTPVNQDVHDKLSELTLLQANYCLHYYDGAEGVKGNQYQSALAAGYSKATASSQASQLMKSPRVKAALAALVRAAADAAVISRTKLVEKALAQADSWLDPDTGLPRETPLVSSGNIVIAEFVVRDSRGQIVFTQNEGGEKVPRTVKQPVVELSRANAANVQALKLAAELCGYVAVRGEGAFGGSTDTEPAAGDTPVNGYNSEQMPDTKLDQFLTLLPSPRDGGARTATVPQGTVPVEA